jgi:hypothetical protein
MRDAAVAHDVHEVPAGSVGEPDVDEQHIVARLAERRQGFAHAVRTVGVVPELVQVHLEEGARVDVVLDDEDPQCLRRAVHGWLDIDRTSPFHHAAPGHDLSANRSEIATVLARPTPA